MAESINGVICHTHIGTLFSISHAVELPLAHPGFSLGLTTGEPESVGVDRKTTASVWGPGSNRLQPAQSSGFALLGRGANNPSP